MKTKISYYVALSVVTLGAMAAVVLSNNGSQGDNNFKNNGEVIYLNKQNLVGEAVGESTLKVKLILLIIQDPLSEVMKNKWKVLPKFIVVLK